LLDTNVLSEVTRLAPDPRVLQWLDRLDEDRSFISVVSIAEIRRGIALMDQGRKRDALGDWLARDLPHRFEQRVLHVDEPVALAWGDLMGLAKRRGRGLSSMDGLIAATAISRELTLATRNAKDFEGLGVEHIDPWARVDRSTSHFGRSPGQPHQGPLNSDFSKQLQYLVRFWPDQS
jgi:predicted nucleic acid-binding protein